MSDDIKELVKRLDEQWDRRRISDSPFGDMSCLLADAADALEALVAERDRLKDEVERLRNEKVAGVAALEAAGAGLSPASGQAPAAEPEVVCDTLVCIWGSNLTQRRSGLHDVSWVRCDGSHVQYYADNAPCSVCGRRVKFAGGG